MEKALVFAYHVPYISHTRYIYIRTHVRWGITNRVSLYLPQPYTAVVDSCVAERFKVVSLQATAILESATTDNKEIDNLYSMKAQNPIRPFITVIRCNGARVRATS